MSPAPAGPASPPAWARLVRAANPGPMTLDGTNTWVLADPGGAGSVVVDPGPDDADHLAAVGAAAPRPVVAVLLTHGHLDHAAGAVRAAVSWGAPVRALDPAGCHGGPPLAEGEEVAVGGLRLRVLATPGHTADSACLLAQAGGQWALLSGDTILGRGTTVVAHPEGRLGDYLGSLQRLRQVGAAAGAVPVLPGHGPVLPDLAAAAAAYLTHRAERLAGVRAALAAGARTPEEVVAVVYADVDRALWPAAELSVRAQLAYLAETG
ncbi:MAG: MBL fold metallo-hydrolase [Actinomycetota bacterium]